MQIESVTCCNTDEKKIIFVMYLNNSKKKFYKG